MQEIFFSFKIVWIQQKVWIDKIQLHSSEQSTHNLNQLRHQKEQQQKLTESNENRTFHRKIHILLEIIKKQTNKQTWLNQQQPSPVLYNYHFNYLLTPSLLNGKLKKFRVNNQLKWVVDEASIECYSNRMDELSTFFTLWIL